MPSFTAPQVPVVLSPRTGCPSPGSPEHTRVPSGLQALPEGWTLHLKHKGSSFSKKIFKNH